MRRRGRVFTRMYRVVRRRLRAHIRLAMIVYVCLRMMDGAATFFRCVVRVFALIP